MVQSTALTKRHANHVALCFFSSLTDGFRNFAGFTLTETGTTFLVADNDKRCEPEIL
eukprot:CAMPEP_0195334828 /NCGR_PEP_ID=MMETSP0708-20121125/15096_1 /TAXON_ID=33640 /ORGANISM="Asterionellopsis glacialis, Strain CCMP134" /LENGTH=56 /DNA_ID=CAMNT_0040404833 /DNA_START=1069 /DNA_END=1236 /DNA_ORIENTATION=-